LLCQGHEVLNKIGEVGGDDIGIWGNLHGSS